MSKHLLATVGASPLAPYLALAHHRPDRATLVHTPQTERVAKRVKEVAEGKALGGKVDLCELAAAGNGMVIQQRIRDWTPEAGSDLYVDITGGTKVVSVHVRLAASELGAHASQVTVLDGERAIPEEGNPEGLRLADEHAPTLDDLLALHGLKRWHERGRGDEETLADRCIETADEEMAKCRLAQYKQAVNDDRHGGVSSGGGRWFERWLARHIVKLREGLPSLFDQLWVGVHIQREGEQITRKKQAHMEADILVRRGWRLGLISCGTGLNRDLHDEKPWEAATVAGRLGGDLARSAVAAMYPGRRCADQDFPLDIGTMRRQVAPFVKLPAVAPPEIFGLDDACAWLAGDREGLREWLKQLA